jgi:hypothetical protein
MLWNQDMKLSDVERAEQLKTKLIKKASNQFAAVAKRNKKEKINQPSVKDNPKVIWKPVLPAYSVPLEDNSASMAAKIRSMGCAQHQAQMHFLLNTPSASIDLLLLCSQDVPSAISTAVEAPGLEEPDPLQQAVDPKLLVSSRSKGPP